MIEYISLKIARIYANKTVSEVAREIKKSQSWVTLMECGARRIYAEDLQRLMKIYGLDDTPLNKIVLNPYKNCRK